MKRWNRWVPEMPLGRWGLPTRPEKPHEADYWKESIVAGYEWQCITEKAAFAGRDGAGAPVLNDRMWLLGGWNPKNWKRIRIKNLSTRSCTLSFIVFPNCGEKMMEIWKMLQVTMFSWCKRYTRHFPDPLDSWKIRMQLWAHLLKKILLPSWIKDDAGHQNGININYH